MQDILQMNQDSCKITRISSEVNFLRNRGSESTPHHTKHAPRKPMNRFSQKDTSYLRKYFTLKYFTQQQPKTLDVSTEFLNWKTSHEVHR